MTLKAAASSVLTFAESLYLMAHGWSPMGNGKWCAPEGYRKEHHLVPRTHAVNSQRVSNRLDREETSATSNGESKGTKAKDATPSVAAA